MRAADSKFCWRSIGVHGDRSCVRLKEHIHCRNCPVFATAARESLDRPSRLAVDESMSSWAQKIFERRTEARQSALAFKIGDEWLGVDTAALVEVAEFRTARRIAHRAAGLIEGLVNIRGEMQLCVSLMKLLGIEPKSPLAGERARLVMVRQDGVVWVFKASAVRGVIGFSQSQVEAPPSSTSEDLRKHVRGMVLNDETRIALLDSEALSASFKQAVFE